MNKLTETIDILRIERTCVQRADTCDRVCETCDLVLPKGKVINAYNTAIAFLDVERNKMELLKGEK